MNNYTWDSWNQLASITSVSNGATIGAFQYDAFGRRATKTIAGTATGFLYDGANVAQELSGTTPTANLLTGGVDEFFSRTDASGTSYPLTTALGNVAALTDVTGGVQTQYTYEPFGATTSSGATSTNSFQHTGRENDGTGLYFHRARYYSPQIQRFISEDPIGVLGGMNLYGYAGNNPINARDPLGLLWSPPGHDKIWDSALGPCGNVPGALLDQIKATSREFDKSSQGVAWSNAHSMRMEWQSPIGAVTARNSYIEGMMQLAQNAWRAGDYTSAVWYYVAGAHPIHDFSSGAHTDANMYPILWCGLLGCKDDRGQVEEHSIYDVSGADASYNLTPFIYGLEDRALRDAFTFMTGQNCGSNLAAKKN